MTGYKDEVVKVFRFESENHFEHFISEFILVVIYYYKMLNWNTIIEQSVRI